MKTLLNIFIALFVSCSILVPSSAFSQNPIIDSTLFKVSKSILPIADGKHRSHFTFDYSLTNPSCASIYRESKFDFENMLFDGPFKDYRADSTVIAEGFYKNGYLDSTLVLRYLNGNIWQKGEFKNGRKEGIWEYYYPNGDKMYVLEFVDNKTKIKDAWDHTGSGILKNGRGVVTIYHYKLTSRTIENNYSWQGKVRNKLMVGKWNYRIGTAKTNLLQYYVNGNFVKGYLGRKMFNNNDYFKPEQDQTLKKSESLYIAECDSNSTNNSPPVYRSGEYYLFDDLYKVFTNTFRVLPRAAIAKVSFDVNEDGCLENFTEESETGVEAHLIESLKRLGPWLPATELYKPIAQRKTLSFYFLDKLMRMSVGNSTKGLDKYRESIDPFRDHLISNPEQWKKIQ